MPSLGAHPISYLVSCALVERTAFRNRAPSTPTRRGPFTPPFTHRHAHTLHARLTPPCTHAQVSAREALIASMAPHEQLAVAVLRMDVLYCTVLYYTIQYYTCTRLD